MWWIEQRRWDELAEVAWYLWVFTWIRGYQREVRDLVRGVLAEPDLGELARTRILAIVGILAVQAGRSRRHPPPPRGDRASPRGGHPRTCWRRPR